MRSAVAPMRTRELLMVNHFSYRHLLCCELIHRWVTLVAAGFGNMRYRGILSLKYWLDRARRMLTGSTTSQAPVGRTAASGVIRATNRVSLIVIAATALLVAMLIGPAGQQHEALTVFVAPATYIEPSEPWPMLVDIDPPLGIPPGSVLHVRGLPPTAILSEGHRVSADVWAVPVAGLPGLEIQVAAGTAERIDLTLALIRRDGDLLAEARTVLTVLEPMDTTTTDAAAKDTAAESSDRRGPKIWSSDRVTARWLAPSEAEPSRAPTDSTAADLPKPAVAEPGPSGQRKTKAASGSCQGLCARKHPHRRWHRVHSTLPRQRFRWRDLLGLRTRAGLPPRRCTERASGQCSARNKGRALARDNRRCAAARRIKDHQGSRNGDQLAPARVVFV